MDKLPFTPMAAGPTLQIKLQRIIWIKEMAFLNILTTPSLMEQIQTMELLG